MSREVLKIQELKTAYFVGKKNERILHHIKNISVNEGEMISVLGLNGSGKSTLIRSILGMQKSAYSRVYFGESNLKEININELAKLVSVVLTDKMDDNFLKVYELVSLGRFPYGSSVGNLSEEDKRKISSAMESMKISDFGSRNFSQLSDGEKQRVLIARAIAQDTPLIILDEPAAFIDSPGKLSIMKMLKGICSKQQKSVLLTTHDIESALRFSDKIWLLSQDGGFESGSPKQMMQEGLINKFFDKDGIVFNTEKLGFDIS